MYVWVSATAPSAGRKNIRQVVHSALFVSLKNVSPINLCTVDVDGNRICFRFAAYCFRYLIVVEINEANAKILALSTLFFVFLYLRAMLRR